MRQISLLIVAFAMLAAFAQAEETPAPRPTSYPITVTPENVREFPKLSVDFANLKLRGDSITVVPIWTKPGVTGVVLIGNCTYSYSPEAGQEIRRQISRRHAAVQPARRRRDH